jgi:hypothetical protein
LVAIQQVCNKQGINKNFLLSVITSRQQPIRVLASSSDAFQSQQLQAGLKDVLKAVALIYTSATFDKYSQQDEDSILQVMANFVISNYGSLGLDEIRTAFEMAAAKKTKADLRAWNGKFTIDLLGGVLDAYLNHTNRLIQEFDRHKAALPPKNYEREIKQKNEETKKQVIAAYLELKKEYADSLEIDKSKIFYHWGEILVKAGYITFTKEEKIEIYKEARVLTAQALKREMITTNNSTKKRELKQIIDARGPDASMKFTDKVKAEYSKLVVIKSIINSSD